MRYAVSHITTYRYSATVHQSYHLLHLSPCPVPGQTVHSHRITTTPSPARNIDASDYFGNPYRILTIEKDHDELVVQSHSDITVSDKTTSQKILDASPAWQTMTEGQSAGKNVQQYAAASRHGRRLPELGAYARQSFQSNTPVLSGTSDLMRRINEDFIFDAAATDVSTPVEAVFEARRGVCQDFAHLMISCLRSLGLPARYVSGYILTHPPPGQPRLQGADASHAWVSVWAPEIGWVDFDPTNNMIPHGEHITIAYGRDYDDVSPISGVLLGGGAHTVDVAVDVAPQTEAD
jgi:transglutaminase-like putative cysteine protease